MQGLADTFILLGMPFDSEAAKQLNKEIFETIYFAALDTSCTLAKADGMTAGHQPPFDIFLGRLVYLRWHENPALHAGPYETYQGSPISKGILQHDMWGVKAPSTRWDWDGLRASIAQHGVRNSLLVAPMPTASTSQVGHAINLTLAPSLLFEFVLLLYPKRCILCRFWATMNALNPTLATYMCGACSLVNSPLSISTSCQT